ncbi:MAG: chromosome segregation protein SMC [Candidatus Brocadiaceae bacterium]|nr:chromosome segregation protein SMC [Candidatus Brocadiaceae bacterium]
MRLKKLELYGFKSFADRTVFDFEDGLSALVGPNGSGKSNVVDAIKWVLGERSAQKLRGAEMVNLIFNGSESRKPLGFAEVKLTIDNSDGALPVDYEEVCIGRRVDRTGQCDYYLNGRVCRLKDVRALLMDTGVGTTAYAVIEQGQIDRILRANPKERRQVFEEAAGINRFLQQRREAERKLERVGQNLARVTDIIEEVQRQLRSVKYQAARARTFKRHAERLQRLRLAEALHSVRSLEADRTEFGSRIRSASAERDALAQQAGEAEGRLEAARTSLQGLQDELADARQHRARVDARLDGLTRECELALKRDEELQNRNRELDQRHQDLRRRAEALDAEREAARESLAEVTEDLERNAAAFRAGQSRIEDARAERREAAHAIESAKAQVFELFQRESNLRNQIEVLSAEKRALQSRLLRIESRREELGGQIAQAEEERSRTHDRAEALHARRAELEARVAALRARIAGLDTRIAELAAQQTETRAELSGRAGRRDVLQDLEDRAEGVHAGVRRLLDARLPGTVGILADLVQVPLEWAGAVEAALGDRSQAVLFEAASQAREALRLLSQNGAGQAELIVLEHLAEPARADLGAPSGVEARLVDVVRCDERAAGAVRALLLNTFVVRDADAASALLQAGLPSGVQLVTRAGERFGSGGLWSGGTPETPSLITRRSELAALDAEIAQLNAVLERLAAERDECQARRQEWTQERDDAAAELEAIGRETGEVNARLQAVETRVRELREELRIGRSEETGLRQDVADLDAQTAELQARSAAAAEERAQAQTRVEAAQDDAHRLDERERALTAELNELGSEVARNREQQRSVQSLIARLEADEMRLHNEVEAVAGEQEADVRRLREAREALQAAHAEQEQLRAQQEELLTRIEARAAAVQAAQEQIGLLAEQAREHGRRRQQVEEALHSLHISESETNIKLETLQRRTEEEAGVRLHALAGDPESWREAPPFTNKLIREHQADLPEQPSAATVAAWYRETERADEEPEQDEAPEIVALEEALALRAAVLEMADDAATDWPQVRAEAARLKATVDRIGNVNVAAIREQEELEIRAQFLSDQKDDLEKARRHEREIIRQLNAKSRERFREVFEQVRQNFQALFRKLFGGGTADLILEQQEEDVLEAGIEMLAKPPGKETNSITLLSGGERALTTVALLFAMFQAKPSPFCLLDELDAPLDDSNVERFLMMLEDFRQNTQFVIITHNKLSMSVAQVLYGLTMTDGVSKQISVKFTEVDHHLDVGERQRAKAG